jgi:hypothetical protein
MIDLKIFKTPAPADNPNFHKVWEDLQKEMTKLLENMYSASVLDNHVAVLNSVGAINTALEELETMSKESFNAASTTNS